VVRLGCDRHRLKPGKRRHVDRSVECQKPAELCHLLVRNFRQQGVGCTLASASPTGDRGAFNDVAGWKNDSGGTEGSNDRDDDGLPVLGAPGGLSRGLDHHRQIGAGRRPESERRGEQPRVIRHSLRATRIIGEWCSRDLQLLCQPLNKRLNWLLQLRQSDTRMPKQSELNGKADPICIPSACCHQVPVSLGQGEAPRHAVMIEGDAKESLSFFIGQQPPVSHALSPD
jgi:hypothetical protein